MKRKNQKPPVAPGDKLNRHINRLNLRSMDEYRDWCAQHGFPTDARKRAKQYRLERQFAERQMDRRCLAEGRRKERGLADVVADICDRKVHEPDVQAPILLKLCKSVRDDLGPASHRLANQYALCNLLLHVLKLRMDFFRIDPVVGRFANQQGNTYADCDPHGRCRILKTQKVAQPPVGFNQQ